MKKTRRLKSTLVGVVLVIMGVALAMAQQPKLPAPFATPSVRNSSRVVAQPAGAQLKVPAGFAIDVYADGLDRPRMMALAPNGDIFVAQSAAGSVVILRDANKDGTPEE